MTKTLHFRLPKNCLRPVAALWLFGLALTLGACSPSDEARPVEIDVAMVDSGPDIRDEDVRLILSEAGEPCSSPVDCVSGTLCVGNPGGDFTCMSRCSAPGALCDDGSLCMQMASGSNAICYIGGQTPHRGACTTNLDCVPTTLCVGGSAPGAEAYCLRACDSQHSPCDPGEFCSLFTSTRGACRIPLSTACQHAGDCPQGLVCTSGLGFEEPALFPGGACTVSCTTNADCPLGACRNVPGPEPETSTALCLPSCHSDGDCRYYHGYRCLDDFYCDGVADIQACRDILTRTPVCFNPAYFAQ